MNSISGISRRIILVAFVVLTARPDQLRAQDANDDDKESVWTISPHSRYENKDISGGVDLSNDLPTLLYGVRVERAGGLSFDIFAANLLGSGGGLEKWSAVLGYSYTATSWLTLSAELSYFKFKNDSLNAIANLRNALTLGVTFPTKVVNIGLSYNTYFGGGSASYYGLNFDQTYKKGDLSFNPVLNFTFISQTIDQIRLASYRKILKSGRPVGKPGTTTPTSVTVTGMSGITLSAGLSYDLGSGFTVDALPAYVYSPKEELAANTHQFLWSVGLTYTMGL